MIVCGLIPDQDDDDLMDGLSGAPIVVTQRKPTGEEETSIRMIEVGLKGVRLVTPEYDPSIPPISFPSSSVEIRAIVFRAIRHFGLPS